MTQFRAVIVHAARDVQAVCAHRVPFVLLSAPGAALYAGAAWWRALADDARRTAPALIADDILDCADAAGYALSALRLGQRALVLHPAAPGFAAVAAIATTHGARVLTAPPPALDLAVRDAARRLAAWLALGATGDSGAPLV